MTCASPPAMGTRTARGMPPLLAAERVAAASTMVCAIVTTASQFAQLIPAADIKPDSNCTSRGASALRLAGGASFQAAPRQLHPHPNIQRNTSKQHRRRQCNLYGCSTPPSQRPCNCHCVLNDMPSDNPCTTCWLLQTQAPHSWQALVATSIFMLPSAAHAHLQVSASGSGFTSSLASTAPAPLSPLAAAGVDAAANCCSSASSSGGATVPQTSLPLAAEGCDVELARGCRATKTFCSAASAADL
jgi:hypothetical protein